MYDPNFGAGEEGMVKFLRLQGSGDEVIAENGAEIAKGIHQRSASTPTVDQRRRRTPRRSRSVGRAEKGGEDELLWILAITLL